jgi:riboflavin biosynthesis pyrimidine reductase
VRQIYPVTGPELELVPAVAAGPLPAAIGQLASLYGNGPRPQTADRPWLRANMIASTDGAAALGGKSGGLGGPADRMVFGVLRSIADVILVGAGTVRAEHYQPVHENEVWAGLRAGRVPTPAIAVVSSSLDFSKCAQLLATGPQDAPTIVITTAVAAGRPHGLPGQARVLVAGHDRVDVRQAAAGLADLGYRQILAEGGPSLLGQLADADLLDELCLTTSPVLAAGPAGRIVTSRGGAAQSVPAARFSLAHVLTDAGFLLSRYVRPAD